MKILSSLLLVILLNIIQLSGQDSAYQFVQGIFTKDHITVLDQSTLDNGRITEDKIILRNSGHATSGAAKFLFMADSDETMFMLDYDVSGAMFSFKYDRGKIYDLTEGAPRLVYEGGFEDGKETHVVFREGYVAIMYDGVVLDRALLFGEEVQITSALTPLSSVSFTGEFRLTDQLLPPMTAIQFALQEIWVEEGRTVDIPVELTQHNHTGSTLGVEVQLVSETAPHFTTFNNWVGGFPDDAEDPIILPLLAESGSEAGTYVFRITDVTGPSARIGIQQQVIVHVIDVPDEQMTLPEIGDIRIIGHDNDIGGDADKLILTNLRPLEPGRTFQIVNATYANEIWSYGNHGGVATQLLTYNGAETLPANSIICLDLLNSVGPSIDNIQINGLPTSAITVSSIQSSMDLPIQIPFAAAGYLFVVDGDWLESGSGYRLSGLVIDGMAFGANWGFENRPDIQTSDIPPAIECTAIQGPTVPGSSWSYYDCGTPFTNVPEPELNLDIADFSFWTSGVGGPASDFPIDVCDPRCVDCCDDARILADCCAVRLDSDCRQKTIQWQYSYQGGSWSNLVDQNSEVLYLSDLDPKYQTSGYQFRAELGDLRYSGTCELNYSNEVSVHIYTKFMLDACTLSVGLNKDEESIVCPSHQYTWYEILEDGSEVEMTDIGDHILVDNGREYRAVVTYDGGCQASTGIYTIPTGEVTLAGHESECESYDPNIINYNLSGDVIATIIYTWESSIDGIVWQEINGIGASDYDPSEIAVTTHYRVRYGQPGCGDWLYSNVITKTVYLPITDVGEITGSQTICETETTIMDSSRPASGGEGGSILYQWEERAIGDSQWTEIEGAAQTSYLQTLVDRSYQYRRLAKRELCGDWEPSNIITKTLQVPVQDAGVITADETRCHAYTPDLIASVTLASGAIGGDIIYQWQSHEGSNEWLNTLDANEVDLQSEELETTTYFRRLAVNENCGAPQPSNVIVKTVHHPIESAGVIIGTQILCDTVLSEIANQSLALGGNGGQIIYQWERRVVGTDQWTSIQGAQDTSYLPTLEDQSYQYRRLAKRALCGNWQSSNIISKTILRAITSAGEISGYEEACDAYTPALMGSDSSASGAVGGDMVYVWQSHQGDNEWVDIANSNTEEFQPEEINTTTFYRRGAFNESCGDTLTSNIVEKRVNRFEGTFTIDKDRDFNCLDVTIGNEGPVVTGYDPVILTVNTASQGNYSYSWYMGDALLGIGDEVEVVDVGTFTAVAEDVNGCTLSQDIVVSYDIAPPEAQASVSGVITCDPESRAILTGTSSTPEVTFVWKKIASNGSYQDVPNGNQAEVAVAEGGQYLLTVTGPNYCTTTTTVEVTEDKTPPNISAPSSGLITCADPQISLTGTSTTPGVTYEWRVRNPNDNGVLITTNATASINAPGEYTLYVKGTNDCVSLTHVSVGEDKSPPSVSASNNGPKICGDDNLVALSVVTSGSVVRWKKVNGPTVEDLSDVEPGTYEVEVIGWNGCSARAITTVADARSEPSISVVPASATLTCDDEVITLTGSSDTPGVSYQWTGPVTSSTQTVEASIQGTYTLTVTDPDNQCMVSRTVEIEENFTIPSNFQCQVKIGSGAFYEDPDCTVEVCDGTTITVGAQPQTYEWKWYGPNDVYITDEYSFTKEINSTADAGVYYAIATDPVNGCVASERLEVEVIYYDNPTVTLSGDHYCSGGSSVISTTIAGGVAPYTYSWSKVLKNDGTKSQVDDYGNVSQITSAEVNDNVNDAVYTYHVTITDANGCIASDDLDISVYSLPKVTVVKEDGECGGDGKITFSFENSDSRTGIEFSLAGNVDENYEASVGDDLGSKFYTAAPGTYDLWVRWGNDQCPVDLPDETVSTTTCLVVGPLADIDMCSNDAASTIAPSVSGASGAVTYAWKYRASGVSTWTYSTATSLSTDDFSSGNYTIEVRVSDDYSSFTRSASLSKKQAPTFDFSASTSELCGAGNVDFSITSLQNCSNCEIEWSDETTGGTSRSESFNEGYTSVTRGVTITNRDNDCSQEKSVTVDRRIKVELNISGNTSVVCGGSVTLTASHTHSSNPTAYWRVGTTNTYINWSSPSITLDDLTEDTNVSLKFSSGSGALENYKYCKISDSHDISVSDLPVSISTSAETICSASSDEATLTASSSSSGTYVWYKGSSPIGTGSSITVEPSRTTTYTVELTSTDGCEGSETQTIKVITSCDNDACSATGSASGGNDGGNDTFDGQPAGTVINLSFDPQSVPDAIVLKVGGTTRISSGAVSKSNDHDDCATIHADGYEESYTIGASEAYDAIKVIVTPNSCNTTGTAWSYGITCSNSVTSNKEVLTKSIKPQTSFVWNDEKTQIILDRDFTAGQSGTLYEQGGMNIVSNLPIVQDNKVNIGSINPGDYVFIIVEDNEEYFYQVKIPSQ